MNIPWDLETTPLQIKTDSVLGSDEEIYLVAYDKYSSWISSVAVLFSSPMQYGISYCTIKTYLPVQPPVEVDKIWTFTKTEAALIITCNGVEVVNYLFADSPDSRCVTRWGRDVEEIKFYSADDASDFYRAGKGLGSHQGRR